MILTICIPSYNREEKAFRLLEKIDNQCGTFNTTEKISVILSNNASIKSDYKTVANFKAKNFTYKYIQQKKNLLFDGNIRFLYDKANTDYVWFFGDDDIILDDGIKKVLDGLKTNRPDILLSSFQQPPGSTNKPFNFKNKYELINDTKKISELINSYKKVSIYVLKKKQLTKEDTNTLLPFYNNGYFWIDLSYTVLDKSKKPSLCIISDFVAASDLEFFHIDFRTEIFLGWAEMISHPFVKKYHPEYIKRVTRDGYNAAILLLWDIYHKNLIVENINDYDHEIKSLPFKFIYLLKSLNVLRMYIWLQAYYLFKKLKSKK